MERLKIIANSSSLPQLGEGAVLNHNKNLKFTFLHVFAVGIVSLFPPYKQTTLKPLSIRPVGTLTQPWFFPMGRPSPTLRTPSPIGKGNN